MSVAVLRPNATLGSSATLTGGATAHAVLSDDSDASYANYPNFNYLSQLGLGSFTLPAGAVAKGARIRLRQNHYTTPLNWRVQLYDPVGPVVYLSSPVPSLYLKTTVTTVMVNRSFTQAEIDALALVIDRDTGPGEGNVYEAYVDLIYVEQPVATVTAPTGTVTDTNRPAVAWTNVLDGDGGPQTHYEVKVFSAAQYGAGGFDPATSITADGTGIVASPATGQQIATVLADGTYRAYVRTAQTVNGTQHWSAWDYEGFVVDVDRPATPTLTLSTESVAGRIAVALEEVTGDATTDDFEVERATPDYRRNLAPNPRAAVNTAGWDDAPAYFVNPSVLDRSTYATPSIAIADGFISDYFTVTCSGANPDEGQVTKLLDAMDVGQRYRAWVYIHRENSTADLELVLGDAVDGQNTTVVVDVPALQTWDRYAVSHTATGDGPLYLAIRQPSATARIFSFTLVLAAEVDDDAALAYGDGDTPDWHWTGAEHASASELGEWLAVRNNTSDSAIVLASSASIPFVVVRDYEASNGVLARYRARALHDYGSGSYAASGWAKATAMWESTQWWLKHPVRPGLNVPVELFSYANVERAARRGVLQPLGARLPIAISDTRGGAAGTITIQARTVAEQDALDALLATDAVLLLQGPAEHGEPDRYVSLGDASTVRVIDNGRFALKRTTVPWVEVDVPLGAQVGDQYAAPTDDDSEELVLA